jgi:hypothetical protein
MFARRRSAMRDVVRRPALFNAKVAGSAPIRLYLVAPLARRERALARRPEK